MAGEFLKLAGFKELAGALRQLPENVARNGLRAGASAAAAVVRNEARSEAPELTGEMKRDIMIKRERGRKDEPMIAEYSVYVRTGKKSRLAGKARNVARDSFYWRFLEFGTKFIDKRPFLRPALMAKRDEAIEAMRKKLDERIQAEAKRLSKK